MINIRFTSDTLPNDTFQVLQLEGEEQISRLFRFELRLVSRDPDIDFKTALEGQASLAITTQGETRYVHGMLSEFEQGAAWHSGLYEYRAVLVPRLWMMSQSVQNQIYQKQTVPDIVQGELDNIQSKGEHPLVMNGLTHADYEIHTVGNYDEREYVVQYRESDFNFISRLMEHEGIYYYFDHDESAEKLVITDIIAAQESTDQAPVQFQADAGSTNYAKDIVYKLSRSQKQIPGSVLMKDFNYRSPSLPLQATDIVVPDGIGFVTEYGAHFKTPEQGEKLVTIRAEEFRCQQNIYSGESHVGRFCCGHVYSLTNHFREDYNQNYLMTRVVHHASQAIESWGKVGGTSYHNEFSCIPADLQYRPPRLTPKPKLYGIMNGVIDSEQDMDRADIDEEGRYKVLMPFDISGAAPGKASRRIRMAQPYGGHGSGMSFPLIKGTEVIWTCIDGDLDRPIITGAVPNPLNPSVTTTENHSSNVIKTSSGITMCFHDGPNVDNQSVAGGGGSLKEQQQYQNADAEIQRQPAVNIDKPANSTAISAGYSSTGSNYQSIEQQQQMVYNRMDLETLANTASVQWSIGLKYGSAGEGLTGDKKAAEQGMMRNDKDVYLRLGAAADWEKAADMGDAWGDDGLMSYVDGNRNLITKGDDNHWHYGGSSDYYKSPQFSCFNDDNTEFYLGQSFNFNAGAIGDVSAGFKTSLNVGVDVEVDAAFKCSFGFGAEYSATVGPNLELSGDYRQESNTDIALVCDPDDGKFESIMENYIPGMMAVTAAGLVTTGVIASLNEGNSKNSEVHSNNVKYGTYGLGALCAVGAIAHMMSKKEGDGASILNMTPNTIDLGVKGVDKQAVITTGFGLRGRKRNTYEPDTAKTITIKANNGAPANGAGEVSLVINKDGTAVAEDKIELVCGDSILTINQAGITLSVGKDADKNTIFITKEKTVIDKPLSSTQPLEIAGALTVHGKGTFNAEVDITGQLDASTIKNDAITANATASAANTSARDSLKKEIEKKIKENQKTIQRNTDDIRKRSKRAKPPAPDVPMPPLF